VVRTNICRDKNGPDIGALLLLLVIVVDHRLAAITVSIFLLNQGFAVMWLPLLDDGTFTVSIVITGLTKPLRQRRPDRREHQPHPQTRASR
jgi:hypothetical protein